MSRILLVEDDSSVQLALTVLLQRAGHTVNVCPDGSVALSFLEGADVDLIISDYKMPKVGGAELLQEIRAKGNRVPFLITTGFATVPVAVELMRRGATDVLTKPFSGDELIEAVNRAVGGLSKAMHEFVPTSVPKGRAIITQDPLMIRILEIAEAVAQSDATVLVQGESGTGKELVARLIHDSSPRRDAPFVAVNCAALPGSLLESELFGHEKGAFTGAHARKLGKFELADKGTILLDEVSEMELILQAKLLRVLQEREVDRVGGRDPVTVDVRVVATTNRNLEEMVRLGGFRADLYYRLNVIPLTLPALRQRKGDVRLLAEYFMRKILGKHAPKLPSDVLEMLESAPWPGNIRELQNAVERAAILARGGTPRQEDFLLNGTLLTGLPVISGSETQESRAEGLEELTEARVGGLGEGASIRAGVTVHEMEKALILETLRVTKKNRTQAASMLGISVRTLRNKLHEYRLSDQEGPSDFDEFLEAGE